MSQPTYRPELPAVTERIGRLPVHRGYPVPWFVAWLDESGASVPRGQGVPDFRVLAPGATHEAVALGRCWICGEGRDQRAAFVAGPMCAVNRTSAEPPSHLECASWSACACPFLARPHMDRREASLPAGTSEPAGRMLRRNPGVALVWVSSSWYRWTPPAGGTLFNMGDPEQVAWFAEGRSATRGEVMHSIETGMPSLTDMAAQQGPDALAELDRRVQHVIEELVTS